MKDPMEARTGGPVRTGGGWGRRLAIVLVLMGAAAFAFSVPLFPCKTCAAGAARSSATCLDCLGSGRLTTVRFITRQLGSDP